MSTGEHRVISWQADQEAPHYASETWVQVYGAAPTVCGGLSGVSVAAFGDERQVYRHTSDGRTWHREWLRARDANDARAWSEYDEPDPWVTPEPD